MVDPIRAELKVDLTDALRRVGSLEKRAKVQNVAVAATAVKIDKVDKDIKRIKLTSTNLLSSVKTIGRTLTRTAVVIGAASFLPAFFESSGTVSAVSSFVGSVASSALIGGPVIGLITAIGGTASLAVALIRKEVQRREQEEIALQKRMEKIEKQEKKLTESLAQLETDTNERIAAARAAIQSTYNQLVYGLASDFKDRDLLGS